MPRAKEHAPEPVAEPEAVDVAPDDVELPEPETPSEASQEPANNIAESRADEPVGQNATSEASAEERVEYRDPPGIANSRAAVVELLSRRLQDSLQDIDETGGEWRGVPVITVPALLAAIAKPLPPLHGTQAEVATPAYVTIEAACPRCHIPQPMLLIVSVELREDEDGAELRLKGKSKPHEHVCGQQRLIEITPDAVGTQPMALDEDDESDEQPGNGTEPDNEDAPGLGLDELAIDTTTSAAADSLLPETCDAPARDESGARCWRPAFHQGEHDYRKPQVAGSTDAADDWDVPF